MTPVNLFARAAVARPLTDHPLVGLDVGARGGFEADLLPIAFGVDAYAFEPEPEAAQRLGETRGPWHSITVAPYGLSGTGGLQTLHLVQAPESASLMEHDLAIGERFNQQHMFVEERRLEVKTCTLDDAIVELGAPPPAYLKIDIEGPELDVLQGGPRTLKALVAIKTEVSFLPLRRRQPLAHDIADYLWAEGFELVDLAGPMRWRRRGQITHPYLSSGSIPYSRAQLVQGDYLFFRNPALVTEPASRVRLAAIAMAYGFFDFAEEVLRPDEQWLARTYGINLPKALREASLMLGRRIWLQELWGSAKATLRHARSVPHLWHS